MGKESVNTRREPGPPAGYGASLREANLCSAPINLYPLKRPTRIRDGHSEHRLRDEFTLRPPLPSVLPSLPVVCCSLGRR